MTPEGRNDDGPGEQRAPGGDASARPAPRRNVAVAVVTAVAVVGALAFALTLGGTAEETGEAGNPCPPGLPAVADPVQFPEAPPAASGPFDVTLATTCGDLTLALDGDAAPQAVGSFVFLARQGYFDGTPCHRLTVAGIFVLQCGDPTGTGTGGPGYAYGPVENAPADDVYPAGTVAMARRGGDGGSMGSQFFLVYEDSRIPADVAGGYTVMGRITEGLDIVRQVAEGGVAPGGETPARSTGIVSVIAEESA